MKGASRQLKSPIIMMFTFLNDVVRVSTGSTLPTGNRDEVLPRNLQVEGIRHMPNHTHRADVHHEGAGSTLPASDRDEGSLRELEVEGTSFNPDGGRVQGWSGLTPNLEAVAEVFAVCNEARIESRVSSRCSPSCLLFPSFEKGCQCWSLKPGRRLGSSTQHLQNGIGALRSTLRWCQKLQEGCNQCVIGAPMEAPSAMLCWLAFRSWASHC